MIYYKLTNISGGLLVCDLITGGKTLRLQHKQSAIVPESEITDHLWNLIVNYLVLCSESHTTDEEYNPDSGGNSGGSSGGNSGGNSVGSGGDDSNTQVSTRGAVRYDAKQSLSKDEKLTARRNIDAQETLIECVPSVTLSNKTGLDTYYVLLENYDVCSTYLVRVSEKCYALEELKGLVIKKYNSETGFISETAISSEEVVTLTSNGSMVQKDNLFVVVSDKDDVYVKGVAVTLEGTYLLFEDYGSYSRYLEIEIPEKLFFKENVTRVISEDSEDKTLPTAKAVFDFVEKQNFSKEGHTHSGYLTEHQDLSDYAKKGDIPNVPSKLSQFHNDSGFATETEVVDTAEHKISEHNVSDTSHSDIRLLLTDIATRLNALADSDDTTLDQLSEIVAYIKSNKNLIDAVTTNKVSVSDIVNDLTTNVKDRPLGADQGVVLKELLESKFAEVSASAGIYVLKEGESESDIPEDIVVAVFPEENAEPIDWSNYYNKKQINEIITKAEFKRGKSAYELAIEGVENPPTLEEWLASLKGEPFTFADFTAEQLDLLRFKFEHFTEDQLALLKGDPFIYEDFTPEQLEGLKFKFEDFTEAELQMLKGEPFRFEDFTQEQLDSLTPKRGTHYWTPSDVASIQTYVDILVSELVDSAPETLDTLWELANALGNDPNFATTVTNLIGKKVDKVDGKGLSTNDFTTAEKEKLAGLQNLPLISNKGYTNEAVWYFPLGKMVVDDSGNFGNFTFNGRIGGWVNNNSAVYSIMLMNRADYTGNIITSTVSASGEVDNALPICDIVVSKNSDKSHTVYLKCQGYFLFNFEWSAYQHSITYDGSYITTEPANIIWRLSTAPKTILSSTGVMYANGKELITKEAVQTMISQLETKIANEYLGGKKLRYANDSGLEGYTTFKKG